MIINGAGFYGDPFKHWGPGTKLLHINRWAQFDMPYIRVEGGIGWFTPFLNPTIHTYPPRAKWTPL